MLKKTETAGTTIDVRPGTPTIKTREINREPIGPITRLPWQIAKDQKAIWTSPFHTSKKDAKWWVIFGVAGAALMATDRWTVKQLPNTEDQVKWSTWTSRAGAAYSLLPISAGFYFLGTGTKNERFRETGILAFETLASTTIVETVLKAATQRERPDQGSGKGRFWGSDGSVWNAGFPSGHAINSWALASVFAHEYPHGWVPIVAYTLATGVVASRVAARRHFPGDVVVGGAMGWFIGDFVYGRRHNRTLDERQSTMKKVLSHIRIGG